MIHARTIALATALAALPAAARADAIARGTIIKIDHQEIYVNLGRDRGAVDGAELRLKRPIALRHPVTRAVVKDWIPLGAASVTQAGDRMSRAVVGDLVGELRVGDLVEVYVDTPDAAAPPPPTEPPAAPVDPATSEVLAAFAAQSGASVDARIATWERYQSAHPTSPYRAAIEADLEQLRALRDTIAPPIGGLAATAPVRLDHDAPSRTAPDHAVPLVFVVDAPDAIAAGWLHYRTAGARTFHRVLLRREDDLYLRGAIPAAATHAGAVEYFVEVTTPRGDGGVAYASPSQPRRVQIEAPTVVDAFAAQRGRTEIAVSVEYLDFANLDTRSGDRTDREVLAEVDVRYQLPGLVRALGAGYGVFAGEGGADAVWEPAAAIPRTGFNYGYAEIEVGRGAALPLSFAARLLAGVGRTGFELGVEGRARIGRAGATNLTASARNVAVIGFLSDLRLETWPHPRLPVGVAVGVLDQPTGDDLAVKLGVDAGYVIGPVAPTLRVSWQGRSIDHGGVGAGLALAFRW